MEDTIYRQQAIDATRNATFSFTIKSDIDFANYRKEIQEIFNNVLDAQEKALNELPSAQPEIIRCKDCKHSEHWYRDRRRCFLWSEDGVSVFDDGFCSYAERRETDDKD